MLRVIAFDRLDEFKCDIDPRRIVSLTSVSAINGEHSLTLVTTQELAKTDRLLVRDGMGVWHEYVVLGVTDEHGAEGEVLREYYCVWSLQYDLSGTFVSHMPGVEVPTSADIAMRAALDGTTRWSVGVVSVGTLAGGSMFRMSGWQALGVVTANWGGELRATIGVSTTGVVTREVDLLAHVGAEEAVRRFDFGHDVTSIRRTVSDEVWPCRIIPLGKAQETEAGGYGRRTTIEEANHGVMWLQDDEVAPYARVPDGHGDWEYPTVIVENDTYDDPEALKEWALANIREYTVPRVTYDADVAQFVEAGMNPHGVALGDEVVVVDRSFGPDGLRIEARVVRQELNLLDASDTRLTIGNAHETVASQLASITAQLSRVADGVASMSEYQSSSTYVSNLLSRLNDEANATGGYTYVTEGQGVRTYDTAVSDPLVGAEASSVVEVKGGTIRIANSRTAGGDWDWKTMLVAGHIAAELVTAIRVVAGFIGSPTSGAYWDIDNGTLQVRDSGGNLIFSADADGLTVIGQLVLKATAMMYGSSASRTADSEIGILLTTDYNLFSALTGGSAQSQQYNIPGFRMTGSSGGTEYGYVQITPPLFTDTAYQYYHASIYSTSRLKLFVQTSAPLSAPNVLITEDQVRLYGGSGANVIASGSTAKMTGVTVELDSSSGTVEINTASGSRTTNIGNTSAYTTTNINGTKLVVSSNSADFGSNVSVSIASSLTVSGSKNRAVGTDSGERLLYAYETPAPLFGDVGGGTIGEDGTCVVEIDWQLMQAARTDMAYHVFLQACGDGALWVADRQPTHFTVQGTPGLDFSWELKAHQTGYECDRMEGRTDRDASDAMGIADLSPLDEYDGELEEVDPWDAYADDLALIDELEQLLEAA